MEKPRCKNVDSYHAPLDSTIVRWNIKNLTWYSYDLPEDLVARAFALWSKHADIDFVQSKDSPNFLLFSASGEHWRKTDGKKCPGNFNENNHLAHADLPLEFLTQLEIHINKDVDFDETMTVSDDKYSLYLTLIHEIGHSLGLGHTNNRHSIMFSNILRPANITSLYDFDLSPLDIANVQALYGKKPPSSSSSSLPDRNVRDLSGDLDLCKYRYKIKHVLIVGKDVYFFHNKWVWRIPLVKGDRHPTHFKHPFKIPIWMPFLPPNLSSVTAVYQDNKSQLVLFVDNIAYIFDFPRMNLKSRYEIGTFTKYPQIKSITGAYINNIGNPVLFTNDTFYLTYDSCREDFAIHDSFTQDYNINPSVVTSVFRHTNGKVYMRHSNSKYLIEYDDYLRMPTGTVDCFFDLFEIDCLEDHIISELHRLTSKLVHMNEGNAI